MGLVFLLVGCINGNELRKELIKEIIVIIIIISIESKLIVISIEIVDIFILLEFFKMIEMI